MAHTKSQWNVSDVHRVHDFYYIYTGHMFSEILRVFSVILYTISVIYITYFVDYRGQRRRLVR